MFLQDGAFHLPTAIANCHLDFSLFFFIPALILCPCNDPSPVSLLKVMSSDLAGAEENVPTASEALGVLDLPQNR